MHKRLSLLLSLLVLAGVLLSIWLNQRTLNPAWYAEAQALDPIFAIDGTDPEALKTAVNVFLNDRDHFAAGFSAAQETEIRRSLYPEEFLRLLPQTQAARVALLRDPSLSHAITYHLLLLQTIRAYEEDAQKLQSAFESREGTSFNVYVQNGYSSSSFLTTQLSAARVAAAAQAQKENTRFACMERRGASCPVLQTLSQIMETSIAAQAHAAPLSQPNSDVLALDAFARASVGEPQNVSPLIALEASCFSYPVTYMRAWRSNEGSTTALRSYIANDLFFWNIAQTATSSLVGPLYEKAQEMGAVYEYQNMANDYMCPDSGQYTADVDRVMNMLALAQEATSSAAKELLTKPVLALSDAARYAQSGSLNMQEQYFEGSAHFDETIGELYHENSFLSALENTGGSIQFSYLYLVRSYASILYFFNNPSFQPQPLSGLEQTASVPQDPTLLSWRKELSKKISVADMLADAKESLNIFDALGAER